MHIGISTSVLDRGRSGVGQYLLALIRALLPHADVHKFSLFVLEEDLPLFNFAREQIVLIPVSEEHRPAIKNILWHQTRLPTLALQLGLDALHVPTYRRMLWPRPCRLVATIHDLAPFHLAGKYDWKRMLYGRVVARQLAKRQDHIIAVSNQTARDLVHFFRLSPNRITVIHNGLDHERFFPGPRERAKTMVAEKYGLNRPFFLYVARLEHPAKNHVRLIAAFEQFKSSTKSDWQLVLAGSDWHGPEEIHRAIRCSMFNPDIRCLGFVPDNALPDLYRAADVFIYPSLYEGFGFPPLEAMACGCPVISSTRGALGEVVDRAAAIVDPEDTASIAEELTRLAGDGKARNQLSAAGLLRAQRFEWKRVAAQTLSVWEKLLVPGRPSEPLHRIEPPVKTFNPVSPSNMRLPALRGRREGRESCRL
ncbi:MAG: glycosyltransferase family 1 protein [Verrucomicrobia bacterium]|nr:MAG: glycosyltransferase family 1 protein [Verrucomicrobiota bacterium]